MKYLVAYTSEMLGSRERPLQYTEYLDGDLAQWFLEKSREYNIVIIFAIQIP